MLVITDERFPDFKMPEQVSGMPRVLGRDQFDRLEDGKSAQGDVVEVPDRRANDVKHRRLCAGEGHGASWQGEFFARPVYSTTVNIKSFPSPL